MVESVSKDHSSIALEGRIVTANVHGFFSRANLPFNKTTKLLNSWNEDLPVKRSRDGQELPADVGERLCKLIDGVPEDGYPESEAILAYVAAVSSSSEACGRRGKRNLILLTLSSD